jgi:DinB superfamily
MTATARQNDDSNRPTAGESGRIAMSDEERALLLDLLHVSRDAFVREVEDVSTDEWLPRPDEGAWSIADCAEHIVVSEEALRRLVREQILMSPPSPDQAAAVQGKDGVVIQAMRDRSRRGKTFDFLEPTGRWPDRMALVARFREEREATIAYVQSTHDPLHAHTSALPALGDLNAFQWLLLLATHTGRHVAQMQEARGRLKQL